MEDIITLIVIVVAIWSLFGKSRVKQEKAAASPQKGGWVAKLNAYFTELQHKLEQQQRQGDTGTDGSVWGELMVDSEPDEPSAGQPDDDLSDFELEAVKRPRSPAQVEPPAPDVVASSMDLKDITATASTFQSERQTSPPFSKGVERQQLRTAVIWSEILGPPVALRDGHGNLPAGRSDMR